MQLRCRLFTAQRSFALYRLELFLQGAIELITVRAVVNFAMNGRGDRRNPLRIIRSVVRYVEHHGMCTRVQKKRPQALTSYKW